MASDRTRTLEDVINIVNSSLPDDQKINNKKKEIILTQIGSISTIIKSPASKKELKLGILFLKESEMDLLRAKRAYSEIDYSDSIYHLQQSAEKLTKAFGLIQGNISNKDLRKINHKTPRAFITMIKNRVGLVELVKDLQLGINTDTNQVEFIINSKDKEIALMSVDQIIALLSIGDVIKRTFASRKVDDIFKKIITDLASLQGKKIRNHDFSISDYSASFIKLFLVAVITYPHESFTRYPDRDIKPSQYTDSMGIVKAAPQVFDVLHESIDSLRTYIEWKNEK